MFERVSSTIKKALLMEEHTCPWWLAYAWDNPFRKFFQDPEKILGPYVRPGDHVADVGCGLGHFSLGMARLVGPAGCVYAIDLQQKMLDVLVHRARQRNRIGEIRPVLVSEESLDFSQPLDFVLCFWMLHEVRDRKKALAEIFSALRPNGACLLVEPRIHVGENQFARERDECSQAGFQLGDQPRVRLSRAILVRKP